MLVVRFVEKKSGTGKTTLEREQKTALERKRKSRLAVKVHRKAVKHVKTSRVMGIVPILGRFQELTKRRK